MTIRGDSTVCIKFMKGESWNFFKVDGYNFVETFCYFHFLPFLLNWGQLGKKFAYKQNFFPLRADTMTPFLKGSHDSGKQTEVTQIVSFCN